MNFKQIHNDGGMARTQDFTLRDNPYYRSENLPESESAALYRAWQMKAEAWEQGWRERDQALDATLGAAQCVRHPALSVDCRAIPLSPRAQGRGYLRRAADDVAA
jgi:hypothetical protein